MIDLKNIGLPEHIFSRFDAIFMFQFEKCMLWQFLFDSYSANDK